MKNGKIDKIFESYSTLNSFENRQSVIHIFADKKRILYYFLVNGKRKRKRYTVKIIHLTHCTFFRGSNAKH